MRHKTFFCHFLRSASIIHHHKICFSLRLYQLVKLDSNGIHKDRACFPATKQSQYILSLSYIPSYVHIHNGYREKSADLQRTLKLHLQFYNRISRLQRLCFESGVHMFLCMLAAWAQMHTYLKGKLDTCVFLASVACPPQLLKGFAHAEKYNHMYLACS